MSRTFNTLKAVLASFAAGLGLMASAAQAETVVSVTQYSYDYMNRPVCSAVRMNTANFGSLPADACTLGTQGTDGPDRISKTTYSASGKPTQIDQAYGVAGTQRAYVRYTYNNHGLKETERDANGNTTTYEYDGFDRLVKVRYPVTTANTFSSSATDYETFGYDANGNRTSWRRRDGNTILYTLDNLNRQIVKDMPGGTAQDVYTNYDGLGHITAKRFVSASGAGVTYAYDGLGRVSSTTDMNSRTVSYTYNLNSTRNSLVYPDNQSQGYAYNNAGILSWSGISAGTVAVAPQYNSLGQITGIARSNGADTSYSYDGVGRLASMSHNLAGTGYDITWTFSGRNPAGQISKWGATSTVYDYKETAGATVNKTFDGLNRDAGIAALSGGYDAKGNMTFDGARTLTYDLENRLVSESAAGVALSLEYDTEGRLSKYTSSGSVTTFLYDGVNLIGEYDGSGAMTKRYMHTLGTDQPWVQFNGAGLASSNAQYLYANYQGSIIALADSSGTVTDMFKYGPYGEPKNSVNFESWTGSRFRYTGQIMLPDARLYYYKARVYDPTAGRFLQTDPVGGEDDLDLYAYVGGDPINSTDPSGTIALSKGAASDDNGTFCTSWAPCDKGYTDEGDDNAQAAIRGYAKGAPWYGNGSLDKGEVNDTVAPWEVIGPGEVGALGRGIFQGGRAFIQVVAENAPKIFSFGSRASVEIGSITTRITKNVTRLGGVAGENGVTITYKNGTTFDMTASRVKQTEPNPYKPGRLRPVKFKNALNKQGTKRSPSKDELNWFNSIDW